MESQIASPRLTWTSRLRRLNRARFWRWLYKRTRPASDPYISGDGFRQLAKHVYDETTRHFASEQVKSGDVVFAATHFVDQFLDEVAPRIAVDFILITHNSDFPADEARVARKTGNVWRWYAQNATCASPDVVPIPIGLENLHHYHAGIPKDFRRNARTRTNTKNRILCSFNIDTNPSERGEAYDVVSRLRFADVFEERQAQRDYLRRLGTYRFVLAPPGNGLDTHRTWEAMYLGVVPIVKDSVAMRSFWEAGLPIWIVNDWNELSSKSEADLQVLYDELRGRFGTPALLMDYWKKRVLTSSLAASQHRNEDEQDVHVNPTKASTSL